MRQDSPDAPVRAFAFAALEASTFLFGPGLIVPFGAGLIHGYVMYSCGLGPRRMAWLAPEPVAPIPKSRVRSIRACAPTKLAPKPDALRRPAGITASVDGESERI